MVSIPKHVMDWLTKEGFFLVRCEDQNEYICIKCQQPFKGRHHYMVTNEVWTAARCAPDWLVHLWCLEEWLGRKITSEDFTDVPLNEQVRFFLGRADSAS